MTAEQPERPGTVTVTVTVTVTALVTPPGAPRGRRPSKFTVTLPLPRAFKLPVHRQSGVWQKAGPVSGEGRKPALRHGPKIV